MKREKRASRARLAGCPLVAGGALGGGVPPPLPPAASPHHASPPHPGRGSRPQGSRPAGPRRPGRAHLHEARTRGPSAKAQLNAGGGGRPKLAFPRPSGARSGRGRTKGAGRGERRVCRGIDLQMRLCQRIKAGRTPDPGSRPPPPGPRPLAAQALARHPEAWAACTAEHPPDPGRVLRWPAAEPLSLSP